MFAPVVYVMRFKTLEEAIRITTRLPQGLSSTLFTKNIQNYFNWVGPAGSDCGIVNCNLVHQVLKLEEHSAVRRKPAAAERVAVTHGNST